MRTLARWCVAALLALCCACSGEPSTAVLVRISADDGVRRQLSSLSVRIYAEDRSGWRERFSAAPAQATRLSWPVEVALVPESSPSARFEVQVTAWDAAERVLIQARAVSQLVPHHTRMLPIELHDACIALGTCDQPDSCHGPTCRACGLDHQREATCAPVGRQDSVSVTPWQAQPELDQPLRYGIAQVGDSCELPGERACARHGGREPVVCDGQVFTRAPECSANEVCDSRVGARLGTCQAACSGRRDESYCEGDTLVSCSVDGVREARPCGAGFACSTAGSATCRDVDECALGLDACAPGICANTEGGYTCKCPEGYDGTGTKACVSVLECARQDAEGHAPCWPGVCEERTIGHLCHCPAGYEGEGTSECLDIDECASDRVCPAATCHNLAGSHECECADGSTCPGHLPCAHYADGGAEYCDGRFAERPMPNVEPGLPNSDPEAAEAISGLRWWCYFAVDYEAMRRWCEDAEFDGLSWRVPSLVEAAHRLRYDPSGFVEWMGIKTIWTSTKVPGEDAFFVVHTSNGTVRHVPRQSFDGNFCCVARALPASAPAVRVAVSNDVAAYTQTGLTWARTPSTSLSYSDAVAYCEALSIAGHDDYRLPSARELYTLIDVLADGRWIDPETFPELETANTLWSQTKGDLSERFALDTRSLELSARSAADPARALCVRGSEPDSP